MTVQRQARRVPPGPGAVMPVAVGVALLLGIAGCDANPAGAEEAISRELFVETFIDLRETAIRTDSSRISDEARAEVLARRGVTEEALLHFVEVYGRDLDFMKLVWDEVERRLEESPVTPPSG